MLTAVAAVQPAIDKCSHTKLTRPRQDASGVLRWCSDAMCVASLPQEKRHTLRSFAAYADWVKAMHFSDPPPKVFWSCKAPANTPETHANPCATRKFHDASRCKAICNI